MPTTVAKALELDKKNDDNHWSDGISSDMNNVRVAFDILPYGQNAPIGHQFLKYHMMFDVKMEDFCRKAQYVAGGHMEMLHQQSPTPALSHVRQSAWH